MATKAPFIGIGAPGALKLLRTLMDHELVQKGADGRYSLGVGCCELARAYLREHDLCAVARDVMHELSVRTGSRVVLAVLEGAQQVDLLTLDVRLGVAVDEVPLRVGAAWPQATGRVLLAFAPDRGVDSHLETYPLRRGVRGVRSRKQFKELLQKIRDEDVAVVRSAEDGLHFVAAPIRNLSAQVIAALGAHATGDRSLQTQVKWVKQAADDISQRIGHNSSTKQRTER